MTEPLLITGQLFYETTVRMANEGVPLRAIARVTKQASEDVRSVLYSAKSTGLIVDIPRDDWPAGALGDRHKTDFPPKLDDEEVIYNCIRLFKVTRLQACLLAVLLKRNEVSKDTMHKIIEARRKPNKEETDPKMVDVVICHLRKRLKPFKITITTLWACGYFCDIEHRKKAMRLLEEYARKQ
jgi:hypothetical protein